MNRKVAFGVPCDDESGPTIELTQSDRAAIIADLLSKVHHDGLKIMLDVNIQPLKQQQLVPPSFQVMKEKELKRHSRGGSIYFVRVTQLKVKGSCVVANYWISCIKDGQYCNLCCQGETYSYYLRDGKWIGTYVIGMVS